MAHNKRSNAGGGADDFSFFGQLDGIVEDTDNMTLAPGARVVIDFDRETDNVDALEEQRKRREASSRADFRDEGGMIDGRDFDGNTGAPKPNNMRNLHTFVRRRDQLGDAVRVKNKDPGSVPVSLKSLANALENDEGTSQRMLASRYSLQVVQARKLADLDVVNERKLQQLKKDALESYNTDLDDPVKRDKLPEEVKQRLYGMYVNRTDLKARIAKVKRNLIEDMQNFRMWQKSLSTGAYVRGPANISRSLKNRADIAAEAAATATERLNAAFELLQEAVANSPLQSRSARRIVNSSEDGEAALKKIQNLLEAYDEGRNSRRRDDDDEARRGRGLNQRLERKRRAQMSSESEDDDKSSMADDQEDLDEEAVRRVRELIDVYVSADSDVQQAEKEVAKIKKEESNLKTTLRNRDKRESEYLGKIAAYLRRIDSLIGLEELKGRVANDIATLILSPLRYGTEHFNIALLGHAGTGKTQVAELLAPLYKLVGIVPRGDNLEDFEVVAPNDLQSTFQAGTAVRTAGLIMRYAFGGVLFIDEVYGLGQSGSNSQMGEGGDGGGGSGAEAITQLVKSLDEFKGLVLVIVAGYERKVQKLFFEQNSGLPSRFPARYLLDDYNSEELFRIFDASLVARAPWNAPQASSSSSSSSSQSASSRNSRDEISEFSRERSQQITESEAQQERVARAVERFLGTGADFVVVEEVPTEESASFEISKEAELKLRAALSVMKRYDDFVALEAVRGKNETIRQMDAIGADLMATLSKIRDIRAEDSSLSRRLEWYKDLISAQRMLESTRTVESDDPVGFFRGTNARGVKQLYSLCVTAWAARTYREKLRADDFIVFDQVIEEGDVRDALYKYTKSMIGVALDFVDEDDVKSEARSPRKLPVKRPPPPPTNRSSSTTTTRSSTRSGTSSSSGSSTQPPDKRVRLSSRQAYEAGRIYSLMHLASDLHAIVDGNEASVWHAWKRCHRAAGER